MFDGTFFDTSFFEVTTVSAGSGGGGRGYYGFVASRKNKYKFPSSKPKVAKVGEEILSGFVDGIPAARGEEFFMQEVRKLATHRGSQFRMALGAPRNMPGWLEMDALIETVNGYRAFEIDDMSFVHLGQRESAETKVKDLRRMNGLAKYGITPRKGIEHIDAADLDNRMLAKKTIAELQL